MEVKVEVEKEMEKEKKYGKFDDWEVEGWARALMEAEEIKGNPEKLKYAKMCLKDKYKSTKRAVQSIDDIRAIAKGEDYESED